MNYDKINLNNLNKLHNLETHLTYIIRSNLRKNKNSILE